MPLESSKRAQKLERNQWEEYRPKCGPLSAGSSGLSLTASSYFERRVQARRDKVTAGRERRILASRVTVRSPVPAASPGRCKRLTIVVQIERHYVALCELSPR